MIDFDFKEQQLLYKLKQKPQEVDLLKKYNIFEKRWEGSLPFAVRQQNLNLQKDDKNLYNFSYDSSKTNALNYAIQQKKYQIIRKQKSLRNMGFNTGELNIISYEEDKFLKTHKSIYIDPPLKGQPQQLDSSFQKQILIMQKNHEFRNKNCGIIPQRSSIKLNHPFTQNKSINQHEFKISNQDFYSLNDQSKIIKFRKSPSNIMNLTNTLMLPNQTNSNYINIIQQQ